MPDRDDFIRIPGADALRVSSKSDNHQTPFEQKRKSKRDSQQSEYDGEIQPDITELDTTELAEYGSIVLNKRNTELKLFVHIKNDSQTTDEALKNELQANSLILQSRIAEYDKELQEYDLKNKANTPQSTDTDLDTTIDNVAKLYSLYQIYLECVKNERNILNIDDIDFLDDIIRQKDDILNQIDDCRKEINFSLFTSISPKNQKKIQVEQLLSDIHSIIGDIFRQEDENRVELQAVKEKMRLEIARQDRGAKAISQFAQPSVRSRFIDTKK